VSNKVNAGAGLPIKLLILFVFYFVLNVESKSINVYPCLL